MFTLGAASVVIPIVYFYVENLLPSLESEADIETRMRQSIEDERMSAQVGKLEHDDVSFKRPSMAQVPRDQLALYLAAMNCPAYFTGPKQVGGFWAKTLFFGLLQLPTNGNGRCERSLAIEIGSAMGIRGGLPLTVAANKIHTVLQKDQLVAYNFSSVQCAEGVIGLDSAIETLFHSSLAALSLSERAELTLAMPVYGYFEELRGCKNPVLLRQNRDQLLNAATEQDLIPAAKTKRAQLQPVACTLQR